MSFFLLDTPQYLLFNSYKSQRKKQKQKSFQFNFQFLIEYGNHGSNFRRAMELLQWTLL